MEKFEPWLKAMVPGHQPVSQLDRWAKAAKTEEGGGQVAGDDDDDDDDGTQLTGAGEGESYKEGARRLNRFRHNH